jgi:hypothetical protein
MLLLLHPRGKAPDTPVAQLRVGNAEPIPLLLEDTCDPLEQPATNVATTTGTAQTPTGLRRSRGTPTTTPQPAETLAATPTVAHHVNAPGSMLPGQPFHLARLGVRLVGWRQSIARSHTGHR